MEMLALYVGYFLYESNADNWWWTGFWAIIGFKVLERMGAYKQKRDREIEEAKKYWEGK